MENFSLSRTDGGIHIEGFPDAVKLILIKNKKAERLAHITLHHRDLRFSLECLEKINTHDDPTVRNSLWQSAIIFFVKCFVGGSRRSSLDARAIYRSQPKAMEVFSYFKNLRDKHFVHDESLYGQCAPCAALNDGNKTFKVEKIFALPVHVDTLNKESYSNLILLIKDAIRWAEEHFDKICNIIIEELEQKSYRELTNYEPATVIVPTLEQVATRRSVP